ncbi:MAG: hypothetical protein RR530_04475 [Clostridium sp.]
MKININKKIIPSRGGEGIILGVFCKKSLILSFGGMIGITIQSIISRKRGI